MAIKNSRTLMLLTLASLFSSACTWVSIDWEDAHPQNHATQANSNPADVNLQLYHNVEKPTQAGDWSIRFLVHFAS